MFHQDIKKEIAYWAYIFQSVMSEHLGKLTNKDTKEIGVELDRLKKLIRKKYTKPISEKDLKLIWNLFADSRKYLNYILSNKDGTDTYYQQKFSNLNFISFGLHTILRWVEKPRNEDRNSVYNSGMKNSILEIIKDAALIQLIYTSKTMNKIYGKISDWYSNDIKSISRRQAILDWEKQVSLMTVDKRVHVQNTLEEVNESFEKYTNIPFEQLYNLILKINKNFPKEPELILSNRAFKKLFLNKNMYSNNEMELISKYLVLKKSEFNTFFTEGSNLISSPILKCKGKYYLNKQLLEECKRNMNQTLMSGSTYGGLAHQKDNGELKHYLASKLSKKLLYKLKGVAEENGWTAQVEVPSSQWCGKKKMGDMDLILSKPNYKKKLMTEVKFKSPVYGPYNTRKESHKKAINQQKRKKELLKEDCHWLYVTNVMPITPIDEGILCVKDVSFEYVINNIDSHAELMHKCEKEMRDYGLSLS